MRQCVYNCLSTLYILQKKEQHWHNREFKHFLLIKFINEKSDRNVYQINEHVCCLVYYFVLHVTEKYLKNPDIKWISRYVENNFLELFITKKLQRMTAIMDKFTISYIKQYLIWPQFVQMLSAAFHNLVDLSKKKRRVLYFNTFHLESGMCPAVCWK